MPELVDELQRLTTLSEVQLYGICGVLAALVALVAVFRRQLAHGLESWQIHRYIRRLGARHLRDLRLPDGYGGEVTIEYLLLGREAVLVIGVKRYNGLIFGGPKMEQWTQVINRVSYKFRNPDEYLLRQVNAVRELVPGIEVRGRHLFTHSAAFSRDRPDNVLSAREYRRLPKRPGLKDIPDILRSDWQQLVDAVSR